MSKDSQISKTPPGSLDQVVGPQPGEVWLHYYHGPVRIVRKWWIAKPENDEYVCEIEMKKSRRALLSASLFEGLLRPNDKLSHGPTP